MGFALPRISWRERAPDLDPPGVLPAKLPRAIDNIGWAFTWGCIGFLLYFTWSSAGNKAVALEIDQFLWMQNLGIKLWLPLVVPYTVISIAVPIMVKYGLPMFMEFAWDKPRQAWPKGWSALLVVGGSLVIIAGSFVVQNDARLEQNRGGAVRVEQAAANKAAKEAELGELRNQLRILTEDGQARPTIEGKAAREGAAGWPAKVAAAKAQADAGQSVDVNRFERAQSAAMAADALRDKITSKIGEVAAMPTQASVADRIVKEGDSATAFTDFVKQWRSLLLALISDLGALFCTWLAMRLADIRAQQLADWHAVHSEPIPDAGIDTLAIEDQTDTWQVQPQDVQYDEDGNELVKVRRKKEEYYRRKSVPKAKKKDDPRAAQMFDGLNEDGQNPQSEVSDEGNLQSGNREAETGPGSASEQEIASAPSQKDQTFSAGGGQEYPEADRAGPDVGGGLFQARRDDADLWATEGSDSPEALREPVDIHQHEHSLDAQEDQQADEPVDAELPEGVLRSPEEDAEEAEPLDGSVSDVRATEVYSDEIDSSETLLPNNEGVLVRTEEEIEDLERQYAARRAATEAAE